MYLMFVVMPPGGRMHFISVVVLPSVHGKLE
jgi:hypothetical protein